MKYQALFSSKDKSKKTKKNKKIKGLSAAILLGPLRANHMMIDDLAKNIF